MWFHDFFLRILFDYIIDCQGTEIWRTYRRFSVKWRRHISSYEVVVIFCSISISRKSQFIKLLTIVIFSAAWPFHLWIFHDKDVSFKRLDSVSLSPKAVVSLLWLLRRPKRALKGLKLIANFTSFLPKHGHVTAPKTGGTEENQLKLKHTVTVIPYA